MAKVKGGKHGIIGISTEKLRNAAIAVLPSQSDAQRILSGVASAARAEWIRQASMELKSTSRDYIQGIQEIEYKGDKAFISLVGQLPNMIEQGFPATDMKQHLLRGPKSKIGADGKRYNTVPFRHGSPGSGGRNVGAAMPKSIHNLAKALSPTVSRPGGLDQGGSGGSSVVYGQRLHAGMKMSDATRKVLTTKQRDHHKSGIHEGMIRQEKTYEGATQSSYSTFRRVSENSDPKAWLHPGITARHLARRVDQKLGNIIQTVVAMATNPKGGGRRR